MEKNKKIKQRAGFIAAYTVVFVIACLGIFLPFIQENKSFMWKTDGLFQTFSAMVYISDYYKDIINQLMNGTFNPEMISFNIGLGYDVFTTLNYYGLGDPLLIFSALFSKDNMHIFYNSLVIIRLYLSGIGFILYCAKMKSGKYPTLIGAVIYVFSGFAIVAGEKHPYFLNAMIYLPFLLIGIESIIEKKKSYLFTTMIFISVVSNYYFFYMLTIMVFLYAFIRFIDVYQRQWKENILNILIRGVVQYLLGILLAGFALIPTIFAFLNNARGTTGEYNSGLTYGLNYYVKLAYSFFSAPYDVNGNFTFLSYAPICFFVIIFLFCYRENFRKYIAVKCGYILATFMLLTPVAGYIMNGMSYASNRWVFGYSFLTAYVVVLVIDDLLGLSAKKLIPMCGLSILSLLSLIKLGSYRTPFIVLGVIFLNIMILSLIIITKFKRNAIKYSVVLMVTIFAVISFGYYQNSQYGYNYVGEYRKNAEAINLIEDTPQASIDLEADEEFYRIGNYGNKVENQSLTMGYNGTSSYYSLVDGNILKYILDNEITTIRQPHRFFGLDSRTYLDTLASVKYYAFEENSMEEKRRPFGYAEIDRKRRKNSEKTDVIYENEYMLPFGYTYDKKISTDFYNTLSSVRKQQAMMQAVVVEAPEIDFKDTIKYSEDKIDYRIQEDNGIMWNKETGAISVDEDTSTLTITFDAIKNCETYIRFVGLDIENSGSGHFTANIITNQAQSKLNLTNSKYRWDLQRENYLVNLGHNNEGNTSCVISFAKPGEYELKDIEVYSLPMQDYVEQVNNLAQEVMTDVKFSNNKISGNINVKKDKVLCFSMLYNTGWKLKIDGEDSNLYKANTMFMAADIKAGNHTIELTYQTPGIKAGGLITMLTLLTLGIFIGVDFVKRRKMEQKACISPEKLEL